MSYYFGLFNIFVYDIYGTGIAIWIHTTCNIEHDFWEFDIQTKKTIFSALYSYLFIILLLKERYRQTAI